MATILLVGLGLVGLAALPVAADRLVLGAGRLAAMLRIAPVVVGIANGATELRFRGAIPPCP